MSPIVLMNDPRVVGIPVRDCGEPLVDLRHLPFVDVDDRFADPEGAYAQLREGVSWRLARAARLLPEGLRLLVTEGYRPFDLQTKYFEEHRSPAPPEVAPHVAGAAVDITLRATNGAELDLGTPVNAHPAECDGACHADAGRISATARRNRRTLTAALATAGLVNYPGQWWHWSYGDRYWAFVTGAPHARYGALAT
ncbi:M15 family metallopeptidase [Streptomyces sp. NPDC004732]|uniref:M15 family metallopeptidase n=1 Tax=Streptomyces sp. NPDC004732 TaxID=3154290 RepID=UPI0033B44A47